MIQNKQCRLAKRPVGMPNAENWNIVTESVPELKEGELLIKTMYISLDPAMRGWMNDGKSYIPPVGIDEVMRAGTAGKVVASKNSNFKEGDFVTGASGVQEYAVSNGESLVKVDTSIAPLQTYLGVLGMPGMTAYFGLMDLGKPQEGETIVISGAAGAVGSVVGQVAKAKGLHVVGIAGGPDKCKYVVEEFGFDACVDYKSDDFKQALKEATPKGVDIYFDNVGGDILDLLLTRINRGARIPICGAISQYNNTTPVKGPSNYLSLLVNRARMEGFVVFDYAPRYREAVIDMVGLMKNNQLKAKEHVVDKDIDAFPDTLLMLFKGENLGKLVLKVAEA